MKAIQKTTLYLPEELHTRAKIEAAKLRISLTELVVKALEKELQRLEQEKLAEGH